MNAVKASRRRVRSVIVGALAATALLGGCGGGGANPFGNPPDIDNPLASGGRKLSFAYFQKCINPIYVASLTIVQNGVRSTNTCAAGGCHDNTNGTGGALRIEGMAAPVDLADAANTPDVIRTTDMYRNFYSSMGETIPGAPLQSRLLAKPLLRNVLHGGGLIFESEDDPNLRLIEAWINRPMPEGQDEFSRAADSMFDPVTGACTTP